MTNVRLNSKAGEELIGYKRMFVMGCAETETVTKLLCPDAIVLWYADTSNEPSANNR